MSRSDISDTYKLLALAGGGVRGVFQARFLQRMEESLAAPLHTKFSAIAATSTGAIVGLAIAAGLPAAVIFNLYQEELSKIFRAKLAAPIRPGGRYRVEPLESVLAKHFGDRRLGDLEVDVFISASTADTYQGKIFTRAERNARLVDVALASAAAPTYFPARRVGDDQRAYLDGGLWANDPSVAAIEALTDRGTSLNDISLLSVGTGRATKGRAYSELTRMRTLSVDTPRLLLDSVSGLQQWHVHRLLKSLLAERQYVEVNPPLREWIALDDWAAALRVLPGLADSVYAQVEPSIRSLLMYRPVKPEADQMRESLSSSVIIGAATANLNTFIPARKYYHQLRKGRDSISSYISSTRSSLRIVSINLVTGSSVESIVDTFRQILSHPDRAPTIVVSLLDPEEEHLMRAVSPNFPLTWSELQHQIRQLVRQLTDFHASIEDRRKSSFQLYCHQTVPAASAILMDVETSDGTIQLETRAYSRPPIESFAFEVGHGSALFDSLREGYLKLISDARQLL
jgi:predicted acylesterase/phospholipase RssA